MITASLDTLKLARKLESAGFAPGQAESPSPAIAEAFAEWQATLTRLVVRVGRMP